eukprot:3126736-Rhodomonas_salina.1
MVDGGAEAGEAAGRCLLWCGADRLLAEQCAGGSRREGCKRREEDGAVCVCLEREGLGREEWGDGGVEAEAGVCRGQVEALTEQIETLILAAPLVEHSPSPTRNGSFAFPSLRSLCPAFPPDADTRFSFSGCA